MNKAYDDLKGRLAEVVDLVGAMMVLGWDHRVMMPRNGAAARSEQLGTIARLTHEKAIAPEIGALLDEAEPWAEEQGYDSDEASLVRVMRRDYEKLTRVPPELTAEMSRAGAMAEPVWQEARQASDWAMFQPHLENAIALKRRYIGCFEPADEDYDILLDDYEPGMKTAEVRAVFDELKVGLVPLIAEIADNADAVDDSCMTGDFPIDAQKTVENAILADFGFTADSWRLDETVHPFASRSGPDDIRLTTKHLPTSLSSIFSSMHEFGHGIYEYGVDRSLARTPLQRGTSLSVRTSRRAACGRTSWDGAAPSGSTTTRRLGGIPVAARRCRRGGLLSRREQGAAVSHPHRGGRGHIQPPHHPPVRARAGDDHRQACAG